MSAATTVAVAAEQKGNKPLKIVSLHAKNSFNVKIFRLPLLWEEETNYAAQIFDLAQLISNW